MYSRPPNSITRPPYVVVAGTHRGNHLGDWNMEGLQAHRVEIDLILPDESAQRRHFRNAGDGLEMIAQVPVLQGAQLRQLCFPEVSVSAY